MDRPAFEAHEARWMYLWRDGGGFRYVQAKTALDSTFPDEQAVKKSSNSSWWWIEEDSDCVRAGRRGCSGVSVAGLQWSPSAADLKPGDGAPKVAVAVRLRAGSLTSRRRCYPSEVWCVLSVTNNYGRHLTACVRIFVLCGLPDR